MGYGLKNVLTPLTVALLMCNNVANADDLDGTALKAFLDARFAEQNVTDQTPGCSVGVIKDGAYILNQSYGAANLEHGIPLSSKGIYRTGSLSKQFTAMAIALLAEEGKIDLDADVHTYLPDLMDYGHKVTVRQMVHHVSGIPDYEQGIEALKTADGKDLRLGNQDYLTIDEFYQRAKTIPLFAPPETKWAYSNTAYFLLSQVVKKVSGMTLRQYADANIFKPLDMTKTFFNDDVNDIVPNRVDGYWRLEDGSFKIFMTNLSWVGDGGVYTNLDDFIKWDQNWSNNKLGKDHKALMDLMLTPYDMDTGRGSKYAFGVSVDQHKGYDRVSHTGSWVGFNTYYTRYPELNLSLVSFCNSNHATIRTTMALEDYILDALKGPAE